MMDNVTNEQKEEDSKQKEKPLHELLTSTIVDIYVGPESAHWPIHERLICYHSPFFRRVFYDDSKPSRPGSKKSYGLPDEDELPFEQLVGWLYSRNIRAPKEEKEVGDLLDLYLLADKLEMEALQTEVTSAVREWYHTSGTYPGLRRVQYIYANTSEDNEMREMMVSSIARQLTTAEKLPVHWVKALQRNGQLAVDIIRAIQQWHIEERSIPDARDASSERGRIEKGKGSGFSMVEKDRNTSVETATDTEATDGDMGVKSIGSAMSDEEAENQKVSEKVGGEDTPPELPRRPPPAEDKEDQTADRSSSVQQRVQKKRRRWPRLENFGKSEYSLLAAAWVAFLAYNVLTWNRSSEEGSFS